MDWLNYQHLLYFWTVVREGGVSKAAEKLRLSQPTVSAQVKTLEDALGERLFLRKGRTLVLPGVGRVLEQLHVRRAGGVTHGPALPGDGAARDREERTGAAQPDGDHVLRRHGPRRLGDAHRLRAATSVLQMRLRDVLREELGGTYSVGVVYSDTSPQAGYGTTTVQCGSSPENAERLTNVVMVELDRLCREGPSETDAQVVKETEKRELETSIRQNGSWLNSLQAMHLLERDPRRILQRAERTESLSRDNIHAVIRKYFPQDRCTVATLMPQTVAQPVAAP